MRLAAPAAVAALLLGSSCGGAWAQAAPPITAVVLYPGSATIVRTATVAPGSSQVNFTGLPARFDMQTLRAEGGPNVRVGQIVALETAGAQAVHPAEAELEAKILALQDQQAALDAEIQSAELVKRYLERFSGSDSAAPGDKTAAGVDAKALTGLLDAIGRGAGEAFARIHRLTLEKRDNEKKIEVLQRNLAQLRTGIRETRGVTVAVNADKPGTIRLSYQVPQAGWKPAYRAALDSAASRLELERLATIAQKTGEDWNGVRLTLSTTQPRLSPTGPDPQPWILSYRPPVPVEAQSAERRTAFPAASVMAGAPPAPGSAADEAAYEPPIFETHGAFATEFVVPTPVTLPADGREVSVTLAKESLAARHYLRVAPRLERAAVVTAEAARPAGVWLPGTTQLLRDGHYVGSAHWNPAGAERFVFSFGRDDLLRVSVDQVAGKSGTTGLFDKRAERTMADVFSITNAHANAVDVLVLESSPVSASEEITVRTAFDPPPTHKAWEQRRGVVAWERKLAPRETARFGVDYAIGHPREGAVVGLR